MIPAAAFKGATRTFGKPKDWDDALDGPCGSLAVQDTLMHGSTAMRSVWIPTTAELAALNRGGAVALYVVGSVHPPVSLSVENPDGSAP